ncbi:fumarate reductase subunit C [Acidobacteria bacterium AH-259-G07]|nr:fumarate reductase subunit C [Acidobacteria bacterium AH-259-G07]
MSPYHRPVPKTWWLKRRAYFLFMIRELTSVFAAAYCAFLLVFIYKLGEGAQAYASMIDLMQSPSSIVLHCVTLTFVLYHTITWFNLTPKIMVLRVGEERVPPLVIAGTIYAGWIVLSLAIAWIVLGG